MADPIVPEDEEKKPGDFEGMGTAGIGAYIALNLSREGPGEDAALTVAFTKADGCKEPIYQIDSTMLPHSMYLFINASLAGDAVVDGRRQLLTWDFWKAKHYGYVIGYPAEELAEEQSTWMDAELLKLGKKTPGTALTPKEEQELKYQLYKQKQNELYCMRSVHMDENGWLPDAAIPGGAMTAKQTNYQTYIRDYTRLPGNMTDRIEGGRDTIAPYVEFTAGHKDTSHAFREPRWRLVYNWVNGRFFLTWHYQENFYQLPNGTKLASPFVYINHVPGRNGCWGPDTAPKRPAKSFAKYSFKQSGLTSWKHT